MFSIQSFAGRFESKLTLTIKLIILLKQKNWTLRRDQNKSMLVITAMFQVTADMKYGRDKFGVGHC